MVVPVEILDYLLFVVDTIVAVFAQLVIGSREIVP
jgi:hypothetical protein